MRAQKIDHGQIGSVEKMISVRIHAARYGGDSRAESGKLSYSHPYVSIDQCSVPVPAPGECLIQVAYCGICGSDFAMARATDDGRMSYEGLCSLPRIPGHEFSGWIKNAETFASGCPVVVEETFGCGHCHACKAGVEAHCEQQEKIGFTRDGAFAAYVAVPERKCWSIQSILQRYGMEAAMKMAAMIQPYAVALSVFSSPNEAELKAMDSILLVGAGPIGLCAIDLARNFGCREIHVVEPLTSRRALATKLGATHVYERMEDIDKPLLFNWLIDSSGTDGVFELAERCLIQNGALVLLSKSTPEGLKAKSRPILLGWKVRKPDGHSCPDAYPRLISLMAKGNLRGELLIDCVVDLRGAQDWLSSQNRATGKVLVKP